MIYAVTFALGSALAGLGGVLYGTIFAIYPTMGAVPTLKAFVVTILGGMGNIRGAIFSGFILGVAETLGGTYISMEYRTRHRLRHPHPGAFDNPARSVRKERGMMDARQKLLWALGMALCLALPWIITDRYLQHLLVMSH